MGQILELPVVTKATEIGENKYLTYAGSCMQGYRVSMEDRHNSICDISFPDENMKSNNPPPKVCFFAIFDGHSGQAAAQYCSENLRKFVISFESDRLIKDNKIQKIFSDDESIRKSFLNCDSELEKFDPKNNSGTTCISVLITPYANNVYEVICPNVGDSRCIFYDQGTIQPLSKDHKPTNKEEIDRIQKAGGYVEFGRVNGTLALSRAFGDLAYKQNNSFSQREQSVIALPDIQRYTFKDLGSKNDYSFIVLACDGIWDVMANKQVVDFVIERLNEQKNGRYYENRKQRAIKYMDKIKKISREQGVALEKKKHYIKLDVEKKDQGGFDTASICEELLNHCVVELESKDNCSATIILFKPQK